MSMNGQGRIITSSRRRSVMLMGWSHVMMNSCWSRSVMNIFKTEDKLVMVEEHGEGHVTYLR
jgi:hypothetical protein